MRIRFEPPAADEFAEAAAYLADRSPQAAEKFAAEVHTATELLVQFPHIGTPLLSDARRVLLRTFPYQLIYRVLGDEIRVYAVAHLKRRPEYWLKRLP